MIIYLALCLFLMIFFIIQSIAFITLFERHLLSLSQNRLGPNKVFFLGVLQAILDGVKLLKKEQIIPLFSSNLFFLFIPGISFLVMMLDWLMIPFFFNLFFLEYNLLFFLCLIGFFVYTTLLSGIISKSKFGMIGGIRSSSQSISYEISFTFFFLSIMIHNSNFFFCSMFNFSLLIIFIFFFISVICELSRAPFDLSEGESELVSGFNTEFSSVSFVLLFLSEYGILIFFMMLTSIIFFYYSFFFFFVFFFLIIFIRSCFPRLRYDFVMGLFWFIFLPISMIMIFYYFSMYM